MNTSVQTIQPTFKGRLTPDFIKATNILRDFKNQGIISPTFEMYRHIKPKRLEELLRPEKYDLEKLTFFSSEFSIPTGSARLESLSRKQTSVLLEDKYYSKFFHAMNSKMNGIAKLRETLMDRRPRHALEIMDAIVKRFKIGNCQEQSLLMRDKLQKAGITAELTGRGFLDHCYLVCNISPQANIKNPSTWGKKAFIVDPWLNKVFRSKEEAFVEYKRIFYNGTIALRNMRKCNNNLLFYNHLTQEDLCSYIPKNFPTSFLKRVSDFFVKIIPTK